MKLKRLQLSLGSLFLATLTFGLGLVGGMRFNAYEKEHQAREKVLREALDALRGQLKASAVLNQIMQQRLMTQKQEIETLNKSHSDELRRLRDELGE